MCQVDSNVTPASVANSANTENDENQLDNNIENVYDTSNLINHKIGLVGNTNEQEVTVDSEYVDEYYNSENQTVEFIDSYVDEQDESVENTKELEEAKYIPNVLNTNSNNDEMPISIMNTKSINSNLDENSGPSFRKSKKHKLSTVSSDDENDSDDDVVSVALFKLGTAATHLADAINGLAQALKKQKKNKHRQLLKNYFEFLVQRDFIK